MSEDSSGVGKIGFLISLIPVVIIIGATQLYAQIIKELYWPLIAVTITFALFALGVGITSLKHSSKRAWAIAGATLGGLELMYMIAAIASNLGLYGQVIQ
jgi:hypothetical protein